MPTLEPSWVAVTIAVWSASPSKSPSSSPLSDAVTVEAVEPAPAGSVSVFESIA